VLGRQEGGEAATDPPKGEEKDHIGKWYTDDKVQSSLLRYLRCENFYFF
jgi:hypothetical protein